jgi:hypothetical protein
LLHMQKGDLGHNATTLITTSRTAPTPAALSIQLAEPNLTPIV